MALTEEQQRLRRRGIGGSDAAAVVGLSPWCTPLELYAYKRSELQRPDLSDNERVRWGNLLEAVVAQAYAEETRQEVRELLTEAGKPRQLRHPEYPWMLAYIDREVVTPPGDLRVGLECKNIDGLAYRQGQERGEWGEPGTDEIPDQYLMQCHHYLAVTGWDRWDLAALVGGNRLVIYSVLRDPVMVEQLVVAEDRFWNQHVLPGVPPEPQALTDMRIAWPRDTGELMVVDTDDPALATLAELQAVKRQAKALKERAEGLTLRLQQQMAGAAELVGPDGRRLATWRTQQARTFDAARFRAEHPQLAAQYMTTRETRPFRVSQPKSEPQRRK